MYLTHVGLRISVEELVLSAICIFSALYLPSMGGVERFTDGLAAELARHGHEVVIVTNDTHNVVSRETLESGVEVVRLPCRNLLNGRYPVPMRNGSYRSAMSYLRSRQCSGVLVNTRFYIHSLLGVKFACSKGIRPVVLDHGSAYLTLDNSVMDWVISRYEDVITSYLKRQPVDFYGISQKSVDWLSHFGIKAKGVINNSIDAASYRLQASSRSFRKELEVPENSLMLSFTGRFIPEKGIGVLLDMMKKLQSYPVHLVMAGDGPLRSKVEEAGLATVHLVGRLDAPDIASLLIESDLFCLPTRSEGFSTSLLEASACGTPSLVTDVGGARELMPDDSYGFVLDSADADAFVSVVCGVLAGEYDLQAMGERCRLRVAEECSWQKTTEKVICAMRHRDDMGITV